MLDLYFSWFLETVVHTKPYQTIPNHTKPYQTIPWFGMVVWYILVWWFGMIWYGFVWFGMVWYDLVWFGMIWYGLACYNMWSDWMVWYIISCQYTQFQTKSSQTKPEQLYCHWKPISNIFYLQNFLNWRLFWKNFD